MTKTLYLTSAVLAAAMLFSCEKKQELSESGQGVALTVQASCSQTKTYLSEGVHKWLPGDLLRILSEDGVSAKSSVCSDPLEICEFSVTGWPDDKTPAYAVYCGQQNVATEPYVEGGKITARVDEEQKITHRNSFAKTANLAVGRLTSRGDEAYAVQMRNVCGLLKFHFEKYDDIKTVVIEDMGSGALAGAVELAFDEDGIPYVVRVKTVKSAVSISANGQSNSLGNSEAEELPAGYDYYACILPGTYKLKITMIRVNGQILVSEAASAIEVERNRYEDLGAIDISARLDLNSGTSNEDFKEGDALEPDYWADKLAEGYHPRLVFSRWEFDQLKTMVGGSDALGKLHDCMMSVADASVGAASLSYTLDASGRRLLAVSREALARIASCAYAYRLTGGSQYLQQAATDLKNVSAFKDWNPTHFLDIAEMAAAVAIGYDWLYDVLDEETKAAAVSALKEKALEVSRSTDSNINWWYNRGDNWNQVCNGGLVCAAVAVYDKCPELAQRVIDDAVRTNKPAVDRMYAPDGAYPEGPTYWNYGTLYQVLMLAVFEKVYGTDYGISQGQGFLETGEYKMFARGTAGGWHYNYADNTTSSTNNYPLYYFAYKRNEPSMLYTELQLLNDAANYIDTDHRGLIFLPIKYAMRMDLAGLSAPTKKFYSAQGDVPIMMCRSGWNKSDLYLGIKGGRANYSHGHMDGGSFVFYADGVRWGKELTRQTYSDVEAGLIALGSNLSDYAQSSLRWKLFRLNNRQHNTITVNDKDHDVTGFVKMISTENTSARMGATFDLTPLFYGDLVKAERTAALCNNSYVEVKDVLRAPSDRSAKVRWTMVSTAQTAEILSDGSGIRLTRNGASIYLRTTGADVIYKTWSANPQDYDSPVKHLEKMENNTTICGYEITVPADAELTLVTTLKKQ